MAATKDQLKRDLADALRSKDEAGKTNIRAALAAIHNEEVAGAEPRDLSDAEELAVVTKEVRKRREAATIYADAERPELAAKEEAEAHFLARYLPQPLTTENVAALVEEAVAELGEPATMKHMGALVKAVSARAEGRAEGKEIAAQVRARLASGT